jgi:single-strand DNA-binding protein
MASFNKIVLVGNLTRDPEYKQLPSGQAVCRLGLATNRSFKNKQSAGMVQEVCFVDVDVWGAQAESCRQYLQKGRAVLVDGRLKLDSWQDATGAQRSKHSVVANQVVFLGSGAGAEAAAAEASANESSDEPYSSFSQSAGAQSTGPTLNPNNKVEKDLMDQLARAEKKIKAAKSAKDVKSESTTGEVDFTDQPPFEDELPF